MYARSKSLSQARPPTAHIHMHRDRRPPLAAEPRRAGRWPGEIHKRNGGALLLCDTIDDRPFEALRRVWRLVNPYIVNLHSLGESSGLIGIPRPIAIDRDVRDEEEGVIKDPLSLQGYRLASV